MPADGKDGLLSNRTTDASSAVLRVIQAEGRRRYRVEGRSAELKLERAREHFETFRVDLERYYRSVPWSLVAVRDGPDVAVVIESLQPIPDSLALVAGDLLNNVRSALDCLITELAEAGRGTLGRPANAEVEEKTLSFPLGERALTNSRLRSLEEFLSPQVVEAVRLLQPVENTKRRLGVENLDSAVQDLVHEDLLLRLQTLNNWDKHRRLTFTLLVPDSVSFDVGEALAVEERPGELDSLRGISWLGLDKPRQAVVLMTSDDPKLEDYLRDPNVLVKIVDPETIRDMEIERENGEPDFDFHFSWWPLAVGDEIGRWIPLPSRGPVPDIVTKASLRLVLFEPALFERGHRFGKPAERLLAEIIDEAQYVIELIREVASPRAD